MVFSINTNPESPKSYCAGAFPTSPKCLSNKFGEFTASIYSDPKASPKIKILVSEIPTQVLNEIDDNCSHLTKAVELTATKLTYFNSGLQGYTDYCFVVEYTNLFTFFYNLLFQEKVHMTAWQIGKKNL